MEIQLPTCEHEPKLARGLCHNCYHFHWRRGTLPLLERPSWTPEKQREAVRAWKAKNLTPARRRDYTLKNLYLITSEDFQRLKVEQEGKCALCGQVPPPAKDGKETLFVDHDHETGQVRALLCHRCNIAVGWAEKCDIVKIQAYLEAHKQKPVGAI